MSPQACLFESSLCHLGVSESLRVQSVAFQPSVWTSGRIRSAAGMQQAETCRFISDCCCLSQKTLCTSTRDEAYSYNQNWFHYRSIFTCFLYKFKNKSSQFCQSNNTVTQHLSLLELLLSNINYSHQLLIYRCFYLLLLLLHKRYNPSFSWQTFNGKLFIDCHWLKKDKDVKWP